MKNLIIGLMIVFLITVIIAVPFAQIWALNTLFTAMQIPYNFWSWLSVVILNGTFFAPKINVIKNKENTICKKIKK